MWQNPWEYQTNFQMNLNHHAENKLCHQLKRLLFLNTTNLNANNFIIISDWDRKHLNRVEKQKGRDRTALKNAAFQRNSFCKKSIITDITSSITMSSPIEWTKNQI